jgi:hypothetical protein
MELLDRYLQAVRKRLPWKRQDDIIAELRANLESQLEDRQAELGRPLNDAEAESWIQQLGSPVQMASHYQPQQYLIGPAVFPAYLHILRLASIWAVVVYMLVSVINAVLRTSPSGAVLAEAVLKLPLVLIQVAAWITLVFAFIEYIAVRSPEKCASIAGFHAKWSPRDLPPLEPIAAPGVKRRTYAHALTEAIFGLVFLSWLLLVPQKPYLMFGPGVAYLHASPYELSPVWFTAYWWIVALNAVQLTWQCVNLLTGLWQKPAYAQHIVAKSMGLVPLVMLATVHDRLYVLLKRPELDLAKYGQTVDQANQGIHSAMLLLCVIVSAQLAWDIARAIIASVRKQAMAN